MQDSLTNAWFYQLKAANRLLIKKNGGIEAAADITSLSKSQIGRCNNDGDTELLPIAAALRLEAECGDPVITRAMAALHGRKISDPDAATDNGACLLRGSLDIGAKAGEYQRNAALAFSDLKVTRAEAAQGVRDIQALIESAQEQLKLYTAVLADGKGDTPGALKIVGGE